MQYIHCCISGLTFSYFSALLKRKVNISKIMFLKAGNLKILGLNKDPPVPPFFYFNCFKSCLDISNQQATEFERKSSVSSISMK